jgi:hypothetical protein
MIVNIMGQENLQKNNVWKAFYLFIFFDFAAQ